MKRRSLIISLVAIVVISVGGVIATLVTDTKPQLGLDLQGGASVDGGVYRRGKELKHFGPKTFRNGRYRFTWRASGKIEHVRFCLSARDRAGNQSGRRCALVSVT